MKIVTLFMWTLTASSVSFTALLLGIAALFCGAKSFLWWENVFTFEGSLFVVRLCVIVGVVIGLWYTMDADCGYSEV